MKSAKTSGLLKPMLFKTSSKLYHYLIRTIRDHIGLKGYKLKYLRHSQITYLYSQGLSKNIIRAISGHSESSVDRVLDNHYLEVRDEKLANQGIAKIGRVRQKESGKKSRAKL